MNQTQLFNHPPLKVSSIIGTHVANADGESLGEIKDVVIDSASGRVAYCVVSFGGFLGMGEKLFAIPFDAFDYDLNKHQYVLEAPKERFKAAQGFDADHWPSLADDKWNRGVNKYYRLSPDWE